VVALCLLASKWLVRAIAALGLKRHKLKLGVKKLPIESRSSERLFYYPLITFNLVSFILLFTYDFLKSIFELLLRPPFASEIST
jgi:hypothetical protein